MNKNEFIRGIANKSGVTLKDAENFLSAFVDTVYEELKKGEKIQISGFGNYELKVKSAREGLNPKTGEKIKIKACKIPTFKFGKAFKDSFNK